MIELITAWSFPALMFSDLQVFPSLPSSVLCPLGYLSSRTLREEREPTTPSPFCTVNSARGLNYVSFSCLFVFLPTYFSSS